MCGPSSFLLSTLPGTSPTGKEAIGGGNMDHQGKKFDGQRGGQNGTLAARTGPKDCLACRWSQIWWPRGCAQQFWNPKEGMFSRKTTGCGGSKTTFKDSWSLDWV